MRYFYDLIKSWNEYGIYGLNRFVETWSDCLKWQFVLMLNILTRQQDVQMMVTDAIL